MGGFLTIGYCFPYCFLETFVGGQDLDGEGQSRDGGITPVPPHWGTARVFVITGVTPNNLQLYITI